MLHSPCLQQRDADAGSGNTFQGLQNLSIRTLAASSTPTSPWLIILLWATTHLTIALDNHYMVKVNGPVFMPIMSRKRWRRSNKVKSCSYVCGRPKKKKNLRGWRGKERNRKVMVKKELRSKDWLGNALGARWLGDLQVWEQKGEWPQTITLALSVFEGSHK